MEARTGRAGPPAMAGRGPQLALQHHHRRPPDRIHAAVHPIQTPDGDAMLDPLITDTQRA